MYVSLHEIILRDRDGRVEVCVQARDFETAYRIARIEAFSRSPELELIDNGERLVHKEIPGDA